MGQKQWPVCKLMEALQTYVVLGSYAETSRQVGVPKSTIHVWAAKHPELVQSFRDDYLEVCREEFVRLLADLRERFGDEVRELVLGAVKQANWLVRDPRRQELLTALLEELAVE